MGRQAFTIRRHIARSLAWTVVVPLVLAAVAIIGYQTLRLTEATDDQLEEAAQELSARVAYHVEQHRRAFELLIEVADQTGEFDSIAVARWLERFGSQFHAMTAFGVMDASGQLELEVPGQTGEATITPLASRMAAGGLPTQPGIAIDGALVNTGSVGPTIIIGQPLDPDDQNGGMLYGQLDLALLAADAMAREELHALRVELVHAQGRHTLAGGGGVPVFGAADHLLGGVLGAEHFSAVHQVPGLNWSVMTSTPATAALSSLAPFALGVLLVLGAALLAATVAHYRMSGRLGATLTAMSRAVEQPHFENISVPSVDRSSPLEVRSLARSLRRMLKTIRNQREHATDHLEHLETIVSQRTELLETRQRELQEFFDSAPALIVTVDEDGQVLYTNDFWNRAIGPATGSSAQIRDYLTDDSVADWWTAAGRVVDNGRPCPVRLTLCCTDGHRIDVSGNLVWQDSAQGGVTIRGIFQDITELTATQRELHKNQELLAIFVRNAPAAIAMFDRDRRVIAVSDRWLSDFRLAEREVVGATWDELLPAISHTWRDLQLRSLGGERIQRDAETVRWPDGTVDWIRWECIPWRAVDQSIGGLVMTSEVVTEQKLLQDQLRILAEYDALTGLLNRRALLNRYQRLAARPDGDSQLGFLFIDLDRFKQINDVHGHQAGDSVLQEIGDRLKLATRAQDFVARLSGDEFVVLLTGVKEDTLGFIVRRYEQAIARPIEVNGKTLEITASVGAILADPGESVDAVLERADRAMYKVKGEHRIGGEQGRESS